LQQPLDKANGREQADRVSAQANEENDEGSSAWPRAKLYVSLVAGRGRKITKWAMEKLTVKLAIIERNLAANMLV
jgi:hypothetical protein